jgi:ankyrin repeat protein
MTVLHSASQRGHPEVVRLLLENGASIEAEAQVSGGRAVHVGYGVCN